MNDLYGRHGSCTIWFNFALKGILLAQISVTYTPSCVYWTYRLQGVARFALNEGLAVPVL